jgi:hypothetical protein
VGKFLDSENRSWEPEINVVTIGRVRTALKINLLELLLPNSTLPEKLTDPCLLVDILYFLCKDQIDKLGIDAETFGRSMTPDGIEDGWAAVLEGIVLFSPRGLRPAHQRVLEKAKDYQRAAAKQVKAMLESPDFDAMIDREMSKRLSPLPSSPTESSGDATSLPESLELPPAGTPSQP